MPLFLKAFMFGVAVAAPVGPMSILCMRRTMVQGFKFGFATALGISISDAIYSAIAAFGITVISHFVMAHALAFQLFAGAFIGIFGVKIFFTKDDTTLADQEKSAITLYYALCSSVLMTMTNPLTILFFVTMFTTLTPASGFDHLSAVVTICGVFLGSILWYTGITTIVSLFHSIISGRVRILIDRITGVALIVFGITEILKVLG